jgi:hypothetical protein
MLMAPDRQNNVPVIEEHSSPNMFVSYLNTLHPLNANNENALAEYQTCNSAFHQIYVRHPLVDKIISDFKENQANVIILTGHAGDGKSTIAANVYKHLISKSDEQPLESPLKKKEKLNLNDGIPLLIIKDLSEWTKEEKIDLFEKFFAEKIKCLLVTNTGTLLEAFCDFYEYKKWGTRADIEPKVLALIDKETNQDNIEEAVFKFYNLALYDNLPLAKQIFEKMLDSKKWTICQSQRCRDHCPIYKNIQLLKNNNGLAVHRIFLAYRKIYEYGGRLTIRQLTSHLAYLLTSGLEYPEIEIMAQKANTEHISRFLFYNRFFGDDGCSFDQTTIMMPVFKIIREHSFGEKLCPVVEREMWFLSHRDDFEIGVKDFEYEFSKIRKIGAKSVSDSKLMPEKARQQVRRALFFLKEFEEEKINESFLSNFLGSQAILSWKQWQESKDSLDPIEEKKLMQKIFHVLQEQFTGTRLPETGEIGDYLYITLNRKNQNLRQSAQVVVAQINFNKEFSLALTTKGKIYQKKELTLIGKKGMSGISLSLDLPFLDYIFSREKGEVGETLKTSFADRLERFKSRLIEVGKEDNDGKMLLVRLMTDNCFVCHRYSVIDKYLEVTDA